MPWKIVKDEDGYFVENRHTGRRMSKRPLARARAVAQLRALEANVHDSQTDKSIRPGRRYRRGAWGNMPGLAKHLAKKYGGDPHFFTKVFNSEELQRVVQYRGRPYTRDQKARIAALAHKYVTGIWPGEHRGKNPNGREKEHLTMETVDTLKGGPGSGNYGHAGRPGHVGGSMPTKHGKGGSRREAPASAVSRQPGRTPRGQRHRSKIDPDIPVTPYPKSGTRRAAYSEGEASVARTSAAFRAAIRKYPTGEKAAAAHNKYERLIKSALRQKKFTKTEIDEDFEQIAEDLAETNPKLRGLLKKRREAMYALSSHVQADREAGRPALPSDHPAPKRRMEKTPRTPDEERQASAARRERAAIRKYPSGEAAATAHNKYERLIKSALRQKKFTKTEIDEDFEQIAEDLGETNPKIRGLLKKRNEAFAALALHVAADRAKTQRAIQAGKPQAPAAKPKPAPAGEPPKRLVKRKSDFGSLRRRRKEADDSSLIVFKEKSGKYRWIATSSNAFKDRDDEIVSLKALAADVERANADGDYGPLRWWHVDGADLGDCDFNLLVGRTLVESGTFRNERIALAVKEAAPHLRISIGFRHPATEPDGQGVFSTIRRFERSILPKDAASNTLTGILVTRS